MIELVVLLAGSGSMPVLKMPPRAPLPAEIDEPDYAEAELEMASQGERDMRSRIGRGRFYRKQGKKGGAGRHAKYKGGGLNLP